MTVTLAATRNVDVFRHFLITTGKQTVFLVQPA